MLQAGIIPVTHFQQNCTVLFDAETKEGVIVDPGGDVDVILQTIQENGITLKAIWLTHGHIDHAGGAKELKEALGLSIIGPHKDDLPLLSRLEEQAEKFGLAMKVENVVPDQWLEDGDTVSFGNHVFEVLHCPGHAPGHVVYFNRGAEFCPCRRRAVPRLDRSHRSSRRQSSAIARFSSATRSCRSAIRSASSAAMAPAARSVKSGAPTPICVVSDPEKTRAPVREYRP